MLPANEPTSALAEASPGANPKAPYYPALDGLRAIAVLLVFFAHYAGFHPGILGVDIFFVLSGFLITGLLFDAVDKPRRYRNFYARRTLRIFPLYYGLWLALLLLTPALHLVWEPVNALWPAYLGNYIPLLTALHPGLGGPAPLHLIRSFASAQDDGHLHLLFTGHFWSLCVEEQFYLVWPWVVFTIRDRRRLLALCAAVVVASPFVRWALTAVLSPDLFGALHVLTPLRLDHFLLGGWAALVLRGPAAGTLHRAGPALLWTGVGLVLATAGLYRYTHPGLAEGAFASEQWLLRYGFSMTGLLALGLILVCLDRGHWLTRLLRLSPLRGLGRISYGFYVFHDLFHGPYLHIARALKLPLPFGLVIPLAGTLAVSLLSYTALERPMLRLKTRFDN